MVGRRPSSYVQLLSLEPFRTDGQLEQTVSGVVHAAHRIVVQAHAADTAAA